MKDLIKILVVDDDKDILTIAKYSLEIQKGVIVQCVSSGEEALRVVPDFQPDLILLDLRMPIMDGEATFEALRALPSMGKIPVILLTATIEKDKLKYFLDKGVSGAITKPFDPEALFSQAKDIFTLFQIQQEYKEGIPQKLSELSALIKAVQRQATVETLTALRFSIHKFAGNAGTFGYMEVSIFCKQFEIEIVKKMEALPQSPPDPKWLAELDLNFKKIEAEFFKVL